LASNSRNRYINTAFWSDPWVESLDPIAKLLFLYLLTNEHTNIAGVYELSIRKMAFESGIEEDKIVELVGEFEIKGKIKYLDGWVILKNFSKHQRAWSADVQKGVRRILEDLPDHIREAAEGPWDRILRNKQKVHRGSIEAPGRSTDPLPYSDSDSDSDFNSDSDSDSDGSARASPHLPPQDELREYAPGVCLTVRQYNHLVAEYGEKVVRSKIDHAAGYFPRAKRKYKDHYRAINAWLKKDREQADARASPEPFVVDAKNYYKGNEL